MRTQSSQHLRDPDYQRVQRAALWSTYYHRFFGPVRSASDVPTGLMPMSRSDTCQALKRLLLESEKKAHPPPQMLRRCLVNILHSGYRPSRPHREVFNYLAKRVVRVQDPDEAVERLVKYGQTQFGTRRSVPAQAPSIEDTIGTSGLAGQTAPPPTQVIYNAGVFTVTKESLIHSPLKLVKPLINPENWQQLAPFFKKTRRVRRDKNTGEQSCSPKGDPTSAKSWNGILYERFVVDWNASVVQTFEVFLKIDYTVTADVVRADYSLAYEKDDQILTDDGYVEGRPVAGRPAWTRYTVQKSVRFASSFLNQVAPAILSMYMETDHEVVEAAAKKIKILLKQPKTKRAELAEAMKP